MDRLVKVKVSLHAQLFSVGYQHRRLDSGRIYVSGVNI